MEHKYNQLSIERYSTSLAKLLCDRYFASNQAINGQQLITFSPVRQINLFVIQELLFRWNQEMAHLKSPYFDFENQEVKEALVQFMNILSRKILVTRPHFEPLLRKAIADTLLWAIDPARIFEEKFLQMQDEISALKLQTHLKYVDINKDYLKSFLEGLALGILPYGNVQNQFKTYLLRNPVNPQVLNQLLDSLHALLPLDRSELLGTPAPQPAAAPSQAAPQASPEPVPALSEVDQPMATAPPPVTPPVPTIAPATAQAVAPAPPVATPAASVTEQPMATAPPPVTPPTPVSEPVPQSAAEVPLNERLKTEKPTPTLNERLARATAPTLAAGQVEGKITSLKDAISINQRFGFINELFNGENLEYYNVIQTLDAFNSADEAKRYVTQDLASRYNWTKKEEHVNRLLRLIERRFA